MLIEKAWRTHHNQSLGEIVIELSILKGGGGTVHIRQSNSGGRCLNFNSMSKYMICKQEFQFLILKIFQTK